MKRFIALFSAIIILTCLLTGCGSGHEERQRERLTLFDVASWEDRAAKLPITTDSDGTTYGLYADINAAVRGKYLGLFKSTSETIYEGQKADQYDGCRMFTFGDEPEDECFLIDNGGQYLIAKKAGSDKQSLKDRFDYSAIADLSNKCIYVNGTHYCTVLNLPSSAAGEACTVDVDDHGMEIKLIDNVLTPSGCEARLFGDHPASECVIFINGDNGMLFASVEYLSAHASELITELEGMKLLKKAG